MVRKYTCYIYFTIENKISKRVSGIPRTTQSNMIDKLNTAGNSRAILHRGTGNVVSMLFSSTDFSQRPIA